MFLTFQGCKKVEIIIKSDNDGIKMLMIWVCDFILIDAIPAQCQCKTAEVCFYFVQATQLYLIEQKNKNKKNSSN